MSCDEPSKGSLSAYCTCDYSFADSATALELGPVFDSYKNSGLNLKKTWHADKNMGHWISDCCSFDSRTVDHASDSTSWMAILVFML